MFWPVVSNKYPFNSTQENSIRKFYQVSNYQVSSYHIYTTNCFHKSLRKSREWPHQSSHYRGSHKLISSTCVVKYQFYKCDVLFSFLSFRTVITCKKTSESEWKFGRTRNAVGTRAAGKCFHSPKFLPKFCKCFYNVIETPRTSFLFLSENAAMQKTKKKIIFFTLIIKM